MEYTGERVIPKLMNPKNGMLQEHIYRYTFAKDFCKGRVLDIACGTGYGSELVLQDNPKIKEFVGIDISKEVVNYAKLHYPFPNALYYIDDALNENLHKIYGTFDTILSFETIEHFEGDAQFVQNLYNLLKPDGILLISTPFGRGKGQPCSCPFHMYQYQEHEFLEVLAPFKNIVMYHQINTTIEKPKINKKYYLMMAVCKKTL